MKSIFPTSTPFVRKIVEVDIRNHDLQQIIDIENGYSDDPKTVVDHVMQLVDLGIAGIYIEDGLDAASLLALKIEAIKDAVARSGPDLFVNARSDVLGAWLKRRS
jgi:2-methylisocitrate lyase-like PEP mutase family enzyme